MQPVPRHQPARHSDVDAVDRLHADQPGKADLAAGRRALKAGDRKAEGRSARRGNPLWLPRFPKSGVYPAVGLDLILFMFRRIINCPVIWEAEPQSGGSRGPLTKGRHMPKLTRSEILEMVPSIDLSTRDLEGLDLSGLNLPKANLRGSNLSGANLSRIILTRADLTGANLTNTTFSGAYLGGTDLSETDLSGADLSDTNLTSANLSGATLSGARYNRETRWPKGFDPSQAGATPKELIAKTAPKARRASRAH